MSEIAAYSDEAYIRGQAPITKREIRVLTIALLGIDPSDVVVDIGAGTGGLTMEAAHVLRQALSTRSATGQRGLLERAARHPIVREDALKNLGYHYYQVGEQTNDVRTMVQGFSLLWQQIGRAHV